MEKIKTDNKINEFLNEKKYEETKKGKVQSENIIQQDFRDISDKFKLEEEDFSKDLIEQEIEKINKVIDIFDKKLNFSVHEETGRIVIKVTDVDDNIIRQIPPEKMLNISAKFNEIIGLIIDTEI
ncbi:MAG: flagellar protein FlaG [Candidatus Muiribacteriota bacterium]